MSLNGSGTYVVNSAGQPVVASTLITAAAFNAFTADIATALSTAVFKDGQQTITANLPMGGFRLTGVGSGNSSRTMSASTGDIQDNLANWAGTAGGTANALTLTPTPAITAYLAGQSFVFKAGASANTSTTTVAISGLTAIAVQANGAACAGGEVQANRWYRVTLDSTSTCQVEPLGVNAPSQGGTGVANNAASTITISGAFPITVTLTASTGVTFPTTGTLSTLAGSETLTNKTVNLSNNTLTGTTAQFNAALSDNDFATLAGTESLTNKTITMAGALTQAVGSNVASAATINLTNVTGNAVHVTGTTTITAVTLATGKFCEVIFDGALTLTHHATNNNLPGAANITTAANDRASYWSDGTTVYCVHYQKADGGAVIGALTGTITMYGASSAPSGWLLCDGTAVSRTTYAALFAIVSTTFGVGDGSTTFNVPDMRSRSPVGMGQGSGLTNRVLGASGGAETHTLSTSEIPSHTHTKEAGGNNASFNVNYATTLNDSQGQSLTTNATGGGGSHNTMHPFLVVNFIIKT